MNYNTYEEDANYNLYETDNGFDTEQFQDAYDDMKGACDMNNMITDTVEYSEALSFTVTELAEDKVIRVWHDKEDNTYCYQYFDFVVDDEPIELSGRYVTDRINIVSADDFINAHGYTRNDLSIGGREPICVFYNDTNNEIPYLGVYNSDDTYSIIGVKYDNIVSLEDMFDMLING